METTIMNEDQKPTGFTILPAVGGRTACLTCGCGAHDTLNPHALLGVGFGTCNVTKDGMEIWSEQMADREAAQSGKNAMLWQCSDAEDEALKDPNHDWRIHFFAALYEAEYQRQGAGHWVLVSKGLGFA